MSNRSLKNLEIDGKLPEIKEKRNRSESSQRRNNQNIPLSGSTYTEDIVGIPKPTVEAEEDVKKIIKRSKKGSTKKRNSSRDSSVSTDSEELNNAIIDEILDDSIKMTANTENEHIEELKNLAEKFGKISLEELKTWSSAEAQQGLQLKLFILEQKTKDKEKSNGEDQEIKRIRETLLEYSKMKKNEENMPSAPQPEKSNLSYKRTKKVKKFDSEIPRFGGKTREDISKWIYELENSKMMNEMSDEEAFNAIVFKLEGGPYDMHRNYNEQQVSKELKPQYKEFMKMLEERYVNRDKARQDREKLLSLKMTKLGNDLYRYNDEFEALVSSIGYGKLAAEDLLAYYKHGLPGHIVDEIIRNDATTVQEAIRIANNYIIRKGSENYVNSISREINRPNNSYSNNRNWGRTSSFSKRTEDKSGNRFKQSVKREFAPRKYAQDNKHDNYKSYTNQQKNFKNETIECYGCKKKGHYRKDCPQVKGANNITEAAVCRVNIGNGNIPNSMVKVNDQEILAYFDTGAECSVMSAETIRKYGFKIVKSDIVIKVASNDIVTPLGTTVPLSVNLGGVTVPISFLVIEHDVHPILLGMDWFNEAQAIIMPSENIITFRARRMLMSNNAVIEYADVVETEGDLYTDNGRPTQFSEFDETAESFGIAPEQVNKIIVETKAKLEEKEREIWAKTVRPAIINRCSPGTHDIGRYNGGEMVIEVTSRIPVTRPIYRRSQFEMEEIEKQNQILLKTGIIEESSSPYNNPIMSVKKKNGKIRLVNDFRGVNAIMVPLIFPIPTIGTILDQLAGNELFSVCDMTSGFWQCPLETESRKYTAYSTPKGHYQYCVCPQGIKVGPSYFNLCVSKAIRECNGFALSYFDDIVVYSKNITDHLNHITLVMKALRKFGFKISAEKSTWIEKEVPLLGFIISGKEIRINPEKINTIKNRLEPKNAKQVESVLGLFQFLSRFIPEFAEKSKCLYALIRKDTVWNWSEECRQAYKHFVDRITSEPAMRQPLLGQAFVVYSDGSKVAIGGMLCQIVDGTLYVIEYASRMLKGSELNYGISDIECLAVVFLVRKWHHYLYGVHFTVYTDHKALLNLMNIRDYHGRLGRQAMFLQEYTFTIKYLPGKENSGADVASRPIFSVTLETKPVLSVTTRNRQQAMETLSINEKEGYKLIDPY